MNIEVASFSDTSVFIIDMHNCRSNDGFEFVTIRSFELQFLHNITSCIQNCVSCADRFSLVQVIAFLNNIGAELSSQILLCEVY